MGDESAGMGAEVGVRKIDGDGDVTEERGVARSSPPRWAWAVFWLLVVFAGLGVWHLLELVHLI